MIIGLYQRFLFLDPLIDLIIIIIIIIIVIIIIIAPAGISPRRRNPEEAL